MRYRSWLAVVCLFTLVAALHGCIGYTLPQNVSAADVAEYYVDTGELKLPLYYAMVSEKRKSDHIA